MIGKTDERETPVLGTTISRRGFVKTGGALFVSLALPLRFATRAEAAENPTSIDPTSPASWLEIRSDNTIVARTGRTETGIGITGYYPQTIAEELNVRPETITLIMGDTDRTPDGGYSAGFLSGMTNVRKVAAYTYQALLGLASTQLGVSVSSLSVTDGVVTGGGKKVTYGELVQGQHLELKIPVEGELPKPDPAGEVGMTSLDGVTVTGNPPMKAPKDFKVIGTSFAAGHIPDKVTGKTQWSCDVRLPGMLHARMVRPATLGSTLVSVGSIDKKQFPTAEVLRKGNLLAVVSPNEWEAVQAAQSVADTTKWTDWSGLPGSENVTKAIRAHKWGKPSESKGKAAETEAALQSATKKLSATYEQGYVRHAPIGPFVAVADVKSDGNVTIWTHSAQSQGLRARIAYMLGIPVEKVIVRWMDHSGQYGRTTFGGDGAEADAAILSQLAGKPVRVQWTLPEDLAWSSVSPAWVSDMTAALDANRQIVALHSAQYSPHMEDPRPVGALLAGMPCAASKPGGWVATEWPYDKIVNRLEDAYGMPNLAGDSANGGLRGNIMRTPGQRQQNFALEGFINEAAAAAGADPIEYRLAHTTDQRLINLLRATAEAANWETRPSPHPTARRSGTTPMTGRGVCIMVRSNAYWVGIAQISVLPNSGEVKVTKFTIGAEPGKIINPRQLDRCMKSGVVMGLSEALKEEVTFDRSKVTSTNWNSYKILTMGEMPEIKVVQISRDDKGFGGGSEAANALVPPALAAALFDATGVRARRIPLTPTYVSSLLKA
ncbi:MAG: xanthine dehydrogenase family protein molybdopterin-binding subunit [Verrucomicrobia bacterium]|nr:MAG: xanthine dehydrogenase family protein molybdopterin-binding subunit [Verrucomicrobiota bacterium]